MYKSSILHSISNCTVTELEIEHKGLSFSFMKIEHKGLGFVLGSQNWTYTDFFLVLPFLFSPNAVPSPKNQPQKFANVHKVFGASNVTKLLNKLHPHQREDAVVYGCVGLISILQHQLHQLQMEIRCAKSELSKCRPKPQKPMNKSNPKQKIKPTLQCVLLLHVSDPTSIAWSFRCLGLVRIGAWVAGFCLLLSSSLFIAFSWVSSSSLRY